LRTISKKRKCSDGTIRKDLQTALGFIDGVLSML
ncbi:antiterminator Q family protein, partial [Klebsiella pneumoniae]